jgi:hypothetical protein
MLRTKDGNLNLALIVPVAFITQVVIIFLLSTCIGPPKKELVEEIDTQTTAFLIPLEGVEKGVQVNSTIDDLRNKQVNSKRVVISQRKLKTGRWAKSYKWVATMRVVKVDRTPVTREWTSSVSSGTSSKDQTVKVLTADGLGMRVPINITISIPPDGAAQFLYSLGGKTLEEVCDTIVRGKVQELWVARTGALKAWDILPETASIAEESRITLSSYLKQYGMELTSYSVAGKVEFEDGSIQAKIAEKMVAETDVTVASQEQEATKVRNQTAILVATAERVQAQQFQMAQVARSKMIELEIKQTLASAYLTAAEQGQPIVPSTLVTIPGNTIPFMNLGGVLGNEAGK